MRKFSSRTLYFFVLLVVFLTHSMYLPNGFTWLDHGDIEGMRSIVPLSNVSQLFTEPFGQTGFYRPLVTLFNSTDYLLYQSFAPGYHLTNVLLHVGVVAVVPLFLSVFFTFSSFEVLLIMLIVGMHPLGWLPVGSISYRPELLVALFIMVTVYLHTKAREKISPLFAMLTITSFFCALLAKETALVLIPALIIFWELIRKQHKNFPILLLYVPEFLILGLYAFMRFQAVPQFWHTAYFQADWSEAIGTRILVQEKLLWHFINPLKPQLSDAVALTGLASLPVVFGIAACASLIFVLRRIKNEELRSKMIRAMIVFGILLAPALGIIPVPRLGSPHYGYIPLVGFAAIFVFSLRFFNKKNPLLQQSVYAAFAVWMAIIVFTTVTSGKQFQNDLTLFTPEVAADHNFLEGYFYLGNYYSMRKDYPKAETAYAQSLQINPRSIAYHEKSSTVVNLALLKLQRGKTQEAIALFESILPLKDQTQNRKMELFIKNLKDRL